MQREMQIRTASQNVWASSVELCGFFRNQDFKSGEGDERWLRFADVERSDTSRGLAIDWASRPVDRQRRSGSAAGLRGAAMQASQRVRRVRALTGVDAWALAWALCIEATSLRVLRVRFGLG